MNVHSHASMETHDRNASGRSTHVAMQTQGTRDHTHPRACRCLFGFVFTCIARPAASFAFVRTRSADPFHSTSPSYILGTRMYVPCLSLAMAKMPSTSAKGSGTSRRHRSASSPAWTSGSTPDTSTSSICWNHSTTRAICGCHARTSSSDTWMRAMSASCTTSGPSRGCARPQPPRVRVAPSPRPSTRWCDHDVRHGTRVHNAIARRQCDEDVSHNHEWSQLHPTSTMDVCAAAVAVAGGGRACLGKKTRMDRQRKRGMEVGGGGRKGWMDMTCTWM